MHVLVCAPGLAEFIRGKPERAPNTRETGSGVYIYIYIYLCAILHGNDSMRMLRHHMVDLTVTGKVVIKADGKVRSAESWQCSVVQAQGP